MMDRNLLLTLVGALMGITIAVLWWPLPKPPPEREIFIETASFNYDPVPPGRRGILLDDARAPAIGVDVYLTEFRHDIVRYWPSVRTNVAGHFPMNVPPGLYRVQALRGFDQQVDTFVHVDSTHPDIELHLATVPLFHFIASH